MDNISTTELHNHNHTYDRGDNYTMSTSSTMTSMKTEDDDMDFQDNKSEASSRSGTGNKSKVFQCTGYGECSMVFTRSEHLARHMRKHTGEKPFKCVVPGCERMFSRFDNMMQHTQTHNKTRGGPRRTKPKTKRGGSKKSSGSVRRAASSDEYDEYGPLPSPPPSRRGSSMNLSAKEHQIILPNPKYLEVDEDDDDDMLISDDETVTAPPTQRQIINYNNYKAKRNLYDSHITTNNYPDSPASSDSSYEYYSTTHKQPVRRRRSAPKVHYQPYPTTLSKQPEVLPILPRRNSALSQLATYLVNNPNESPESYLTKNCPPKLTVTRRLSIQDLSNPIDRLDASSTNLSATEEGVDLTEDEYQAIQGFGQFYRSAITCSK